MLADAVVDSFVMAAQDHQVLLARQFIRHLLRQLFPVGRREDDLVVRALCLQLLHQREYGLDHHHHPGVAAEAVIVDLTIASLAVFAKVVHVDFNEPFVLGALHNGIAERAFQQLRHDGQDIDSHKQCKNSEYFKKKTTFASYN